MNKDRSQSYYLFLPLAIIILSVLLFVLEEIPIVPASNQRGSYRTSPLRSLPNNLIWIGNVFFPLFILLNLLSSILLIVKKAKRKSFLIIVLVLFALYLAFSLFILINGYINPQRRK